MMRSLLLAVVTIVPMTALATPIDFTQVLSGVDRKPLMECKEPTSDGKGCDKSGPVTLGEIASTALMSRDKDATLEDQIRRARLAQKVLDAKSIDLSSDETKLIKDQVGKMGTIPIIVLDVVSIIDPASLKDK